MIRDPVFVFGKNPTYIDDLFEFVFLGCSRKIIGSSKSVSSNFLGSAGWRAAWSEPDRWHIRLLKLFQYWTWNISQLSAKEFIIDLTFFRLKAMM